MTSIICLFPVLARPHRVQPLFDSLRSSQQKVELSAFFLVSPNDVEEKQAVAESGSDFYEVTWDPGPGDWAMKINLGYQLTDNPWILLGADDLTFDPGWAEEALKVASATGKRVIGTNDMANPTVMKGKHSTHPLVARSYVDEFGTIDQPRLVVHEGYGHQWCDTELNETAMSRGEWVFAQNSRVRHHHPFYDRSVPRDDTYMKGLSSSKEDSQLFRNRRALWQTRHAAVR